MKRRFWNRFNSKKWHVICYKGHFFEFEHVSKGAPKTVQVSGGTGIYLGSEVGFSSKIRQKELHEKFCCR